MLKTVGFPSTRTGDQTIVAGNLVIGTAGKGIDFSADPSAAGMTSELLDDYEEGTWTPSFTDLTTSGTVNITGRYTKVGRTCTCTVAIQGSGGGTSTSVLGTTRMSGLPFTLAATSILSTINANNLQPIAQCLVTTSSYLPTWTTLANVLVTFEYETV